MRDLLLLTLAAATLGVPEARAQQLAPGDSLEARVWLDRGEEPVVQRGDDVRVYYRTSADAYVAIFRIDTDGRIELLFPQHPGADVVVRGGRDYRLLFPRSPRWRVEEDPGVGYFFMIASPEPLDFALLEFDERTGWDLSSIGADVYEDPYVAIDDYVATIVPDWEVVPYGLDFLTYSVGDTHTYPRFLCYDCHERRPFAAWNPYVAPCPDYRVVIWDDPYFYPRYRYVGTRVVFARPIAPRPRYGVVVRAAGSAWTPLVRHRDEPARRVVEYKEAPTASQPVYQPRNPRPSGVATPSTARTSPSGVLRRAQPPESRGSGVARGGTRAVAPPSARGTTPRDTRRGRSAPAARPPATDAADERARPTLQRRPVTPSGRLPDRAMPGTTSRGTTSRGTTSPGTTSRGTTDRGTTTRGGVTRGGITRSAPSSDARRGGAAAPSRSPNLPTRIVRPPTSTRPPAAAPNRGATSRGGSTGRATTVRPPQQRPAATSRPPTRGGSGARRPPPSRRRGGRGGGEGGGPTH
jgi:hypothetical protein